MCAASECPGPENRNMDVEVWRASPGRPKKTSQLGTIKLANMVYNSTMKLFRFHWLLPFIIGFIAAVFPVGSLEFSYKFKAGDKYRIVSTVNEDVFVDRKLTYRAEFINRITMEVSGLSGERARLLATFQSAEKTVTLGVGGRTAAASSFQWAKDYQSEFEQDKLGYMTMGEEFYMPMVRDVPVFPGRELYPGETWTAKGIEVHDFRDSYGIEKPYRIPFTAYYTYLGERTWKEKEYPAFSVSYRVFLEPEPVPGKVYPRRIQGAADQTVFWDTGHGQVAAYEGYFRNIFDLSDGQTWEYRGKAEAEVVEAPPMDKDEMAKDIAGEIFYGKRYCRGNQRF